MRSLVIFVAGCMLATAARAGDLGLNGNQPPTHHASGSHFKFAPSIEQYKRSVARHILAANRYSGSKAAYRNITVVGYTIDRRGAVSETWVVRSSGDRTLDQHAISTFRKALPLPTPPGHLFEHDPVSHLSEAFVHTSDGGYKLQTLLQ